MPSGVFDPEARPESPVSFADGAREPRSRREEEADARASSTTSNEEMGRDPHRPEGLRRHDPSFVVAAPRRWRTSPSPWRLESGAMALATDDAGGSGRTSQGAESYLTVRRAPRREKTLLGGVHRRPQHEAGETCGLYIGTSGIGPAGDRWLLFRKTERSNRLHQGERQNLGSGTENSPRNERQENQGSSPARRRSTNAGNHMPSGTWIFHPLTK